MEYKEKEKKTFEGHTAKEEKWAEKQLNSKGKMSRTGKYWESG